MNRGELAFVIRVVAEPRLGKGFRQGFQRGNARQHIFLPALFAVPAVAPDKPSVQQDVSGSAIGNHVRLQNFRPVGIMEFHQVFTPNRLA